jgi:hypothetical protein
MKLRRKEIQAAKRRSRNPGRHNPFSLEGLARLYRWHRLRGEDALACDVAQRASLLRKELKRKKLVSN